MSGYTVKPPTGDTNEQTQFIDYFNLFYSKRGQDIFVGPLIVPEYPAMLQSMGRYLALGLMANSHHNVVRSSFFPAPSVRHTTSS